MYKENNPKKKNIRALFLLIVLTVFGVVVFKYTRVNKISADTTQNTEVSSCSADVVDNSYESNETFLNISDDGEITDVTPKVLGTSTCTAGANQYTGESACTLEQAKSSFSLQGWVNSDAPITMTEITAPIRLLSGSFAVKDSNGNITLDDPYYPPAGKVNKVKLVAIKTAPGEMHDEVLDETVNNAVRQEAYSAEYTVDTDGKSGSDTLTINQYAQNDCGEMCDNEANNNPDSSNKTSKFLSSSYSYPGQVAEEDSEDNNIQIEGVCKNTDTLDTVLGVTVCWDLKEIIKGTFGSLFPSSDWTGCSSEEEGCINSETIAVKISPMFKETNKFTEIRNKSTMDPDSASNYKSVYVITACKANVGGKGVNVKCIWDMSYLFNLRKSAEFDDIGGSQTPTVEQYKNFLREESSSRTDALYSM